MEETANKAVTPVVAEFRKTIWVSRKEAFEKKLRHLNKILAKHGKEQITWRYENVRPVKVEITTHMKGDAYRNDTVESVYVEMCDVVCRGLTLVKKDDVDYVYLGTVSFADGVKQVFCNNEEYGRYFMDDFREGFCDHCRTVRMNRNTYYMFLNPAEGKVLQIGSKCAKEYFGIDSTAFLETYGKTFFCVDDGFGDGDMDFKRGAVTHSFGEVARVVSFVTSGFLNWHKASEGEDPYGRLCDQPTVGATETVLCSWGTPDPIFVTDKDCENAKIVTQEEVLAFWKAKKEREGSTFAYNCYNAIEAGYATHRSLGAFCWAIFAAFNAKIRVMRDAEAAKGVAVIPCAYAAGTRQVVAGRVTGIRTFTDNLPQTASFSNPWGVEVTKYIVDFKEDNGTLYHFITSAAGFSSVKAGDAIRMRCTIGETKEFKGLPYTRVSRPLLLEAV